MTTKQASERQQKVIDGLKANKTVKQIAAEMKITPNGVQAHIRRLRKAGLIEAGNASKNGGGRRRATPAKRRTRRNGSRKNRTTFPEAKAIEAAVVAGRKRIEVIEGNIANLQDEKAQIESAISGK